ncbi:MAG: cAMP-activated global transcriptional regulator CRP [Gammaproteobacteria bacterium]|nr:cAMP-activated global transcriptional regulator CRP [Gammaproteobacteria bacterium]
MPLKKIDKEDPALERFLQHCHRRSYAARTTIIHGGDRPDTLYYITKGSVSVLIEDHQGRELVLAYLSSGDFFGEMGLFDPQVARSAWVIARSACEIAEIHYDQFKNLAMNDAAIIFKLASQIAIRLRKTSQKVCDLAFLDVTGRVAHTLLELAREPDAVTHPNGMQLKITRQEIARIVGCSREMAGRVLKDLEIQGLVTAHGKTIVVLGAR